MANVTRWMRQHQKKFLAALVVFIMVTWTIGGAIQRLMIPSQHRGGEIFGNRISGDEYAGLLGPLTIIMPQAARRRTTPAHVWETLLMNREAERMGIETGDPEIVAWRREKFVDGQGRYKPEDYRQMLQYYGLTPREFENALRLWLTSRKVTETVRESVDLTADEAWLWWASDNRKVQVEYAFLSAAELMPYVEVNEEEVQQQYDSGKDLLASEAPNQAGYLEPERIKMEYILIPYEPLEEMAVITDKQVERYYEENKEEYRLYTAAEIQKKDKDKSAARYQPLDDVADDIEKTLREAEARRVAEEMRENLMKEVDKARYAPFGATEVPKANLKEIAKGKDVRYEATDWFNAEAATEVIPGAYGLGRQVFGKGLGNRYIPRADVAGEKGLFIYQVTEVELPRPAPLSEIRDRVVADAKRQKAMEEAVRIVSTAVEGKETLDAVVEEIEKRVAEIVSESEAPKADRDQGSETPDKIRESVAELKAEKAVNMPPEKAIGPSAQEGEEPDRKETGEAGGSASSKAGQVDEAPTTKEPVADAEGTAAEKEPGEDKETAKADKDEGEKKEPEKKSPVVTGKSDYFARPYMWQDPGTNRSVPIRSDTGVPGGNRGYLAHEAFRLRKGRIGFCYEPEGDVIGAYALVLLDTQRPDRSEYEKQASQLYPEILMEKMEAALRAWRADVLRRARPSNDVQQALLQLPEWQAAVTGL